MSPSGGRITTVEPSMMWSPENSMRSCSSRKQRWFGRVAGRVQGPETNSVASMTSPSPSGAVDLEAVAGVEGQHLGAGALLEPGGAGEVVDVGVGADDPADAVAAAAGDGVEVGGVVGAGVDDHDLVDADQVGVGARPGHEARVVGDDAAHERAQGAGHAVDDGPRAAGPRCRGRVRSRGTPVGAALVRSWRPSSSSHVANRPMSRRQTVVGPIMAKSPARWRVAGRRRAAPTRCRSARVVVGVGLALGRAGEEEAGVEALGLALRGDPVGEVAHARRRASTSSSAASTSSSVRSPAWTARRWSSNRPARRGGRRSGPARRRRCGPAARRPPRSTRGSPRPSTPRPPLGEAEPRGRLGVGEARAARVERRVVVGGVDDAAGEHVHAAERRARVPAEHEDLERPVGVGPSRTSITVAPSRVGTAAGHRASPGRSGGSSQLSTSQTSSSAGAAEPVGIVVTTLNRPPRAPDATQDDAADQGPGGRQEQEDRQQVGEEPGGDHQRAGEQHERAVDDLARGHPARRGWCAGGGRAR